MLLMLESCNFTNSPPVIFGMITSQHLDINTQPLSLLQPLETTAALAMEINSVNKVTRSAAVNCLAEE